MVGDLWRASQPNPPLIKQEIPFHLFGKGSTLFEFLDMGIPIGLFLNPAISGRTQLMGVFCHEVDMKLRASIVRYEAQCKS